MDEILDRIVSRARELGGEPEWLLVFTVEITDGLARLLPEEYEKFKTRLEGTLLLEGLRLKGLSERKLDRLVRMAWAKAEEESATVPLSDCCPGAPGVEGLLVPGPWRVSLEGVSLSGAALATFGAVYVNARYLDAERGRGCLRLAVYADGEWRQALVPADCSDVRLVGAVKNLGVFVESPKGLVSYLQAFLAANWSRLPVVKGSPEGEAVFEAWRDYVETNAARFAGGPGSWGMLRGEELLVLPDVLRRFLRGQGAPFQTVLSAWRRDGCLLAADDGLLAPRWFNGRTRRVVVFPSSLFDLGNVRQAAGQAAG